MKLSVIIPAHNEADSLPEMAGGLIQALTFAIGDYELIVVNDHSHDETERVLQDLCLKYDKFHYVNNEGPPGFGYAVRAGFDVFNGDCVAIMMADMSDCPEDLIVFYHTMVTQNIDCIFGSRWSRGGKVQGYPMLKWIANRIFNKFIQVAMNIRYNDTTNAFKLYKRDVIEGIMPILSPHFNLTIELPLKAIIRGYSYKVVPNSWKNRKTGVSKLKIKEMGSRYMFILLYCFIEKYFSKGDYRRPNQNRLRPNTIDKD